MNKRNILFLCTGNSCRSQMAEGWLRHLKGDLFHVYSAGIETHGLNPNAVKVMAEAGVDISSQRSQLLSEFDDVRLDYVITVCGHAHESCPTFLGDVKVIHVGFDDPPKMALLLDDEESKLDCYRRVRDEIRDFISGFEEVLIEQHELNAVLREEIMSMEAHDLSVRAELISEGKLSSQSYHPRMQAVHEDHAARLTAIIEQHGWPTERLVSKDGANAAWLIAQHAIGDPPFMRRCLGLIKQASAQNEVPLWQAAMMEDRIRKFEGKPQVYGTQFETNHDGELVPYTIEAPESVDDRRRAVGLNTLEERIAEMRKQNEGEKLVLTRDWQEAYEKWLHSVGWR